MPSSSPAAAGGGGGGGQPAPREIAAWLHIGEDGKITVYTGKAEVGQNIRTSLTQVVAEELHAPPQSIHLVMADTQLTPFDMGTFGSRTTPDMSQRLRRTAAAAREMLIDLAAEIWKTDRALLRAASGSIVHSGTGQKARIRQADQRSKAHQSRRRRYAPTPPAELDDRRPFSQPKVDGRSFVTGGHQYASDIKLPGMLFGKVLRPPSFGATLTSVDLSGAKSMPGVVVVHDGEFVGVAAPSSLAGVACAGCDQGRVETWSAALGQGPLREPEVAGPQGAAAATATAGSDRFGRQGSGIRRHPSRADLYDCLHRPCAARAACGRRAVGRRKAHRLDRISASLRRARRAHACLRSRRRCRASDRARHRRRLRRQAHR